MSKLTWKKCGIRYYDTVYSYLESKFEKVGDFKSAERVFNDLEKMTPKEISDDASNTEYDVACFHKEVMNTAYNALWKFYQI